MIRDKKNFILLEHYLHLVTYLNSINNIIYLQQFEILACETIGIFFCICLMFMNSLIRIFHSFLDSMK